MEDFLKEIDNNRSCIGISIIIQGVVGGGAGEFGHTNIYINGITCKCGNKGCLESYFSWPVISKQIINQIKEGRDTILSDVLSNDGKMISEKAFVDAIQSGDSLAIEMMNEMASYLAVGIVNIVHLFNPQVIILGGDITNHYNQLIKRLSNLVEERTLKNLYNDLRIMESSLGKEFEMIGAASILLQDKFQFKLTEEQV